MKLFKQFNTGLVLIIATASLLRLIALGDVPYGFANDEVSYIYSGFSIAQTNGYDVAGKFLPLSVNLDSSLSPVPVYFVALFVKLLGLGAFVVRLPFALLGIGSVILTYYLSKMLFKNELIAIFAGLVMSFSSWHILVTRGVWDVIPAQFFLLLGICLFVKKVEKGSVLWSLIPFIIAFYSYHATKVFYIFLIGLLLVFFGKTLWKRRAEFVLFLAGSILVIFSFILVLSSQSVTRQTEFVVNNPAVLRDAEKNVNFNRRFSDAPFLLRIIESNKVEFIAQKVINTYLGAFSVQHLFSVGDINPIVGYGAFFRGVLYIIDLPFLLLGLFIIVKTAFEKTTDRKHSRNLFFTLGLLLISPLPSAVAAGTTYVIRSFMMVPFLSIVIGFGIWFFTIKILKKSISMQYVLFSAVLILYCVVLFRFFYQYSFQFNTYGGEFWNRSSRILSEYISKNQAKFDSVIIGEATDKLLLQFAFFNSVDPAEMQKAWIEKWPAKIGKVNFNNSCLNDVEFSNLRGAKKLYISPSTCHLSEKAAFKISDPLESQRVIWKIYK